MKPPSALYNPRSLIFVAFITLASPIIAQDTDALLDIPLEELMTMDVVVSTAAKRQENLSDSASATFVLTAEDLRRSAITNIADAFRMVPGMHVARLSTNEWAVASRGLNGRFSPFLQVLIDGRSRYNSLLSGVNWDELNLILEDIDRIEVIRGPSGSLWGTNAVNGVVNIVTKRAHQDKGTQVTVGAGNDIEKGFARIRHSMALGSGYDFSVSAMHHTQDGFENVTRTIEEEDWDSRRLGIAVSRDIKRHQFDLRLDGFKITANTLWPSTQLAPLSVSILSPKEEKKGHSFSLKDRVKFSDKTHTDIRISSDFTKRESDIQQWESSNFDIDLELTTTFWQSHRVNIGINSRRSTSFLETAPSFDYRLTDPSKEIYKLSGFIQDQWEVTDKLFLTLAAKTEDDSNSGSSFQPSIRAMWMPTQKHRIWGAVSTAVGTVPRGFTEAGSGVADRVAPTAELPLPIILAFTNSEANLENSEVDAFEAGYRYLGQDFNLDITAYRNKYGPLFVSVPVGAPVLAGSFPGFYLLQPIQFSDQGDNKTQGFEVSAAWHVTDRFMLQYSGSYYDEKSEGFGFNSTTPRTQHSLRSFWDINNQVSIDMKLHAYGDVDFFEVDSYVELDARIEWQPSNAVSFSLVGRNLIEGKTAELRREAFFIDKFENRRDLFLQVNLHF